MALSLLRDWSMVILLVMIGVVSLGFLVGLLATATAPMGYQDETGFHLGNESASADFGCAVPEPKAV
ncbi:MAG: hypothetical protein U1F98_16610 [Verrucomicrobiota bacterium]